jgi:hypothetical protein
MPKLFMGRCLFQEVLSLTKHEIVTTGGDNQPYTIKSGDTL